MFGYKNKSEGEISLTLGVKNSEHSIVFPLLNDFPNISQRSIRSEHGEVKNEYAVGPNGFSNKASGQGGIAHYFTYRHAETPKRKRSTSDMLKFMVKRGLFPHYGYKKSPNRLEAQIN